MSNSVQDAPPEWMPGAAIAPETTDAAPPATAELPQPWIAPAGWIPFGYDRARGIFCGYKDNRHLITFGPTRSGKGATTIIQTLLLAQHSILCLDPKGQNTAITARRRSEMGQSVHLLNPFNEFDMGTSRFNPLAHLSIDDPNVLADVSSLAEALILGDDKSSAHWSDSARTLVRTLILHLVEAKGGAATLGDMRRLLTQSNQDFAGTHFDMVSSARGFISQPAAQFGGDSKELQSIFSTARTQTAFLDDPLVAHVLSGSDFSMMQLKEKPTTVYLILPGRYIEAYARFFRLLVTSAIDQLTARAGGHKTLLILDEFAAMQNLAAVSKAFGFAAGYNVQLWPFLQDIPQLKAIYGERWESFVANAGLVQFFTPSDMTTAEYMQKRCGTTVVIDRSYTQNEISVKQQKGGFTGRGEQIKKERIPLLQVETAMSMSGNQQVVLFSGVHDPAIFERWRYTEIPRLAGLFDPDPFHT